MEPFTRTPFAEAQPIPAKKLNGIEITSAQGQLITRNVSARVIHSPHIAPVPEIILIIGGKIASKRAPPHTAGV